MKLSLEQFFSSSAYAVVGVSSNREKYGNIVYRYLRAKQFPVYPVHPRLNEVEGDPCYASVADLPDTVKSVVTVVPPEVTEQVITACAQKGISAAWMQPGAESFAAIEFANANGIAAIYDACVMVILSPVPEYSGVRDWLKKAQAFYE